VIVNRLNSNQLVVGNHCVELFGGDICEVSTSCHAALKRLQDGETEEHKRRASEHMITLAKDRSIINQWEFDFYTETRAKRKLTDKQKSKLVQINKKLLSSFT
jgi:hypothetical protein